MKRISLVVILIFCSGFAPPSIDENNQGVKEFSEEKYNEAFKNFADALAKDSYNPTMHFNLADAFYKNNEPAKALSEFEGVENSPKAPQDLKFKSMFNAGNVAVEMKDIPKALQYYQKALEYNPGSVETKTNIELALRDPQGGGGGKGDKDKEDKDKKNQDDKKDQDKKDQDKKDQDKDQDQKQKPGPQPQPTPRATPKPFKSQALNENDVRRILEELKRQEQEIRAKQDKSKKHQERQIEKDW